jgi:TPR repeat protein
LLQKAAINGNAQAQYGIGVYFKGFVELQKALEWFEKSAYQGNADAQYELGKLYQITANNMEYAGGEGFIAQGITTLEEARQQESEWLKISAQQGNNRALYEIAVKYRFPVEITGGFGVDYEKEKEYIRKAAINGNIDALEYLLK